MSEQGGATLNMGKVGGEIEQVHTLRGLLPGDWESTGDEGEKRFECDLGDGLPRLRIEEKDDNQWIGTLITARFGDKVETDPCDGLQAAAVYLRERLQAFAAKKRRRTDKLLDIVQYGSDDD